MKDSRERRETRNLRLLALIALSPIIGGIFYLVFGLIGYLWGLLTSTGAAGWGRIGFWVGFVLTVILIVRALILGK